MNEQVVRGEVAQLREYLTWLAGYAAIPGDSAFGRRLKMAREAVDRLATPVAQARPVDAVEAVETALLNGEVMRTRPRTLCKAYSPESRQGCRLEPGHARAHLGFDPQPMFVWWA